MKTLLAIIITAAFCYAVLTHPKIERRDPDPPKPDVAANPPSPVAAAAVAPKPAPAASKDSSNPYNQDGSLKPLPPGTRTEKFWGAIVQHMDGGKLLMQTNHGRIVLQMPGELAVPDGTYIPKFDGAVLGTCRYVTTDGATRDVWEVLYLPPGAVQTPTPQPGAWRLERAHSTLGRATPRALSDQQRMAEWAKQVQGR